MTDQVLPDHSVRLSVPLHAEYASVVRMLVSSIGADLGFTVDELDDLRLGVSELFTLLVDDEPAEARRAVTTVHTGDDSITVTMSREVSANGTAPAIVLDGLASSILSSVVDSHDVTPTGVVLHKLAREARS